MLTAAALSRPSWQCIHFASADDLTAELRAALAELNLIAVELRSDRGNGDLDLLQSIGEALGFPAYYGANWDALDECLRDLPDFKPAPGYVVTVIGARRGWRDHAASYGRLVEAWLGAAEEAAHDDIAYHLVFVLESEPA